MRSLCLWVVFFSLYHILSNIGRSAGVASYSGSATKQHGSQCQWGSHVTCSTCPQCCQWSHDLTATSPIPSHVPTFSAHVTFITWSTCFPTPATTAASSAETGDYPAQWVVASDLACLSGPSACLTLDPVPDLDFD